MDLKNYLKKNYKFVIYPFNMYTCRICHNTDGNKTFLAKEMMLGLRESFEYFECQCCGCLQISTIPNDLGRFYPQGYYSFNATPKLSDNYLIQKIKFHRSN